MVLEAPGAPLTERMLPRPELRHAFVLKPLADLAPDYRVPGDGRRLAELWEAHPDFALPPLALPWPAENGGA